jgi:hypothetical protein
MVLVKGAFHWVLDFLATGDFFEGVALTEEALLGVFLGEAFFTALVFLADLGAE